MPDASPAFVPLSARTNRSAGYKLPVPPPRGPDAGALAEGRAAVVGGRYYELFRENAHWQLLSGAVDGQLDQRSFSEAQGCRAARIAGFGKWLYVACSQ